MIDPDEASDPQAKNMLDRIFSRMGKEQHYPMAISEIMQGYETYYRARGNTSGGGASGPGSSSWAAGRNVAAGHGFRVARDASAWRRFHQRFNEQAGNFGCFQLCRDQCDRALPLPVKQWVPKALHRRPLRPLGMPSRLSQTGPFSRRGAIAQRTARLVPGKEPMAMGKSPMAEFTDNSTPEKVAEFARYDLDHDGIITAAECLKVEKAKAGSK